MIIQQEAHRMKQIAPKLANASNKLRNAALAALRQA